MKREHKYKIHFDNHAPIVITLNELMTSPSFLNLQYTDVGKVIATREFTGLHDKNGKEIYEGDIVTGNTSFERSSDEEEWTNEKPCAVLWSDRCSGFYPFIMNNRWRCDVENIEIIGNIYENPELLNQI